MKLLLGKDFPASPPKGYFLTRIFHPNVGANGEICVNVLKRDWTAELGIRHVLLVRRAGTPHTVQGGEGRDVTLLKGTVGCCLVVSKSVQSPAIPECSHRHGFLARGNGAPGTRVITACGGGRAGRGPRDRPRWRRPGLHLP